MSTRRHNTTSSWQKYRSMIFLGILVGIFLIGVIVANTSIIQKSQDLRQQASEEQLVQVEVRGSQNIDNPSQKKLSFWIDTNALPIDGLQLVFRISNLTPANLQLNEVANGPLTVTTQPIENEPDLVGLVGLPRTPNPYANDDFILFAELTFEADTRNPAILEFNNQLSNSTVNQTVPAQNKLALLEPLTVYFAPDMAQNPSATPSNSGLSGPQGGSSSTPNPIPSALPTNSPTPTPEFSGPAGTSPTPTPTFSPRPTNSPTTRPSATPTATPRPSATQIALAKTPTPTPIIIKTCNQSCTANRDCAVNFSCYQGACRLASNPTNPACQTRSITLQSCNESCQSNKDCETGLTCFQSSCRNPLNLSSTSCANATLAQSNTITKTPTPRPTPTPTKQPTPAATSRAIAQQFNRGTPTPTPIPSGSLEAEYFQINTDNVVNVFGDSPSYQAALDASESGAATTQTTDFSDGGDVSKDANASATSPSLSENFFSASNDVLFGILGVIVTTILVLFSFPFLLKLSKKNLSKTFSLAHKLEKPVSPLANFPGKMPGGK